MRRIFCISFIVIALILFLSAFIFFHTGFDVNRDSVSVVLVSIDDVSSALIDIIKYVDEYDSVFDNDFFSHLRYLHSEYGLKITLFSYYDLGDYTINDVPSKFYNDFHVNSTWLKFQFHWISPSFNHSTSSCSVIECFDCFSRNILTWGDSLLAESVRLHYFYATDSIALHLRGGGVKTLLCADDGRISYNLTSWQDSLLKANAYYQKDGLCFRRTDLRLESCHSLREISKIIQRKDTVVIFTHEWLLVDQSIKNYLYNVLKGNRYVPNFIQYRKFDATIKWLYDNKYKFVI